MDHLEVVEAARVDDRLRESWDALASQQMLPSPFLRSWWLEAMPAPQRVLLVMHEGDRLVGAIPLARDRILGVPRYRFLGQGVLCPDHLDLMAAPGFEEPVADAFAAWFEAPGTRLLDASGLVQGSLLARALGVPSDQIDVAPFQELPPPGDDFLAGRSANFRRSVRRRERRHAQAGITHRRAETTADIEEALEAFRALHEGRPGREQFLAELPALRAAVLAGAERGEVQVDLLADDDGVVAVTLFFCTDGRLSFYQLARSLDSAHDGAGTTLLYRIVVSGIAAGFREIDLLRGDERYKASFADDLRELHRVRVGHGVAARLIAGGWRTASRARNALADRRAPAAGAATREARGAAHART